MARTAIIAALLALACGDAATGGTRAGQAAGGSTLAVAVAHREAAAHRPRAPQAARSRADRLPGPPPGPGYCWYYIDRSTRAPGFWDMCRER
jgi:hypothetical protein